MILAKTELKEIRNLIVKIRDQLNSYQYNAFVIPEVSQFLKEVDNTLQDIDRKIDKVLKRI